MKIRVKLYAMLGEHLPANAHKNEADYECAEGTPITEVLSALGVPLEQCHLVLINGVFVPPSERTTHGLNEGDALAVWPPVAGG